MRLNSSKPTYAKELSSALGSTEWQSAIAMECAGSGSPEELRRLRLSSLSLEPNDVLGYLKAAETMENIKNMHVPCL